MRYCYAYTGKNLILGHGRTIRQLVPDTPASQRLFKIAGEYYARYAAAPHRRAQPVPAESFIAALLAPLAVQEFGDGTPGATPFSSAGQLLRLFDGLAIEQAAANLFNGRTANAYAGDDAADLADRVAQGFVNGDLLLLPRDAARLRAQDVLNALPGAAVFLLSHSQAERNAFAGYLRRGAPPAIPADVAVAIAKTRPVLRTWEREARLKRERAST